MRKQPHCAGVWGIGLALVLVGFLGTSGFAQGIATTDTRIKQEMRSQEPARTTHEARAQGVRMADGYNVTLRTPDTVFQHQTVELEAVVRNNQGQRVDGIPVTFRVTPEWQENAHLVPEQVMTQNNGIAHAWFKSGMPGRVMVTAQVGNTTDTDTIFVDAQGSSISDNYRAPSSGEAPNSLVP